MRRAADFFGLRGLLLTMGLIGGFCFASPAFAGTADNVEGWAWSGTVGWISLNCTNTATCGTADYGVRFDDILGQPGNANISGYAWADAVGWICFGATCTGTTPEGGASYAQYRVLDSGREDQLYGWAQVVNLGADGWLSLNCANLDECATSNYFTSMDPATGSLTKGAAGDHWAWGSNSDTQGLGWIDMSSVSTTWVFATLGQIGRPQGVFEPEASGLPGTHLFTFSVSFTQFTGAKDERLECDLELPDETTRNVGKTLPATVRGGTETLTYTVETSDTVEQNRLWLVSSCTIAGNTTATSCVSDATCGADALCDEGAGKCRPIVERSTQKRPVYTHANTWTGLQNDQDQYSAIKCHAGFPGTYFNNPSVCDFAGDASFSLAQRRGIPTEGDCGDGLDNDGNGEVDCADRNCQGISYLCQTTPRASCVNGQSGDGILDCSDASYEVGGLCCTRQPVSSSNPNLQRVVNGLECATGEPNDGYYDCGCDNTTAFNASGTDDCFSPGATAGDLCCDANSDVVTK